ncbi:MAG: hypothetical protein QOE35_947 [Actinomycetota bacterium]
MHTGSILSPRVGHLTQGGVVGVDVFFVLSGFLITALLLEEHAATNTVSLGRFYARRALRLFPALAVMLTAHVVYTWVTHGDSGLEERSVAAVLGYATNWYTLFHRSFSQGLVHMWSLANEEQFYLVWPLTLAFLARRSGRGSVVRGLVAAAAAFAVIRWLWWGSGSYPLTIASVTFGRMGGMFLGAALGFVWKEGRLPTGRWLSRSATVATVLCVLMLPVSARILAHGGFDVVTVGTVVIIAALLGGGWRFGSALFGARGLRALGRISYPLYLWHVPVFYAVAAHLHASGEVRIGVAFLFSFAAAVGSLTIVERPFLALKSRLPAGTRQPVLAPV